jgi:hypothetical protein
MANPCQQSAPVGRQRCYQETVLQPAQPFKKDNESRFQRDSAPILEMSSGKVKNSNVKLEVNQTAWLWYTHSKCLRAPYNTVRYPHVRSDCPGPSLHGQEMNGDIEGSTKTCSGNPGQSEPGFDFCLILARVSLISLGHRPLGLPTFLSSSYHPPQWRVESQFSRLDIIYTPSKLEELNPSRFLVSRCGWLQPRICQDSEHNIIPSFNTHHVIYI